MDEGGTGTYTVQLDSEPTGNIGTVIVTINDPTDNTHVTTAPEFLTFTNPELEQPADRHGHGPRTKMMREGTTEPL